MRIGSPKGSGNGRSNGNHSGHTDEALMERMSAGDDCALIELHDRLAGRVFAIALRVLRDPCDAEDVVQETFVQVWRRPGGYDPARGGVPAWICVIARTRALDRLRRRRGVAAPGAEVASPGHVIEDVLCMRQALDGLTPDQRIAIELAYYEGMSQSEIAGRLGAPLGTVKGRIRAGMTRLRETLSAEGRRP